MMVVHKWVGRRLPVTSPWSIWSHDDGSDDDDNNDDDVNRDDVSDDDDDDDEDSDDDNDDVNNDDDVDCRSRLQLWSSHKATRWNEPAADWTDASEHQSYMALRRKHIHSLCKSR